MTDPRNIVPDSYYDSLYERNESPSMKECPECKGAGRVYYSDCCGVEIIEGRCQDCQEFCIESGERCEECNGEGGDRRIINKPKHIR